MAKEDFKYGHKYQLDTGIFTRAGDAQTHRLTIDRENGPSFIFQFSKKGKITQHIDMNSFEEGGLVRKGADVFKDLNPKETQSFVDNQYRKPPLNSYEMTLESGFFG